MSTQERCPICGEGHVTAMVQMVESEYKGQKTQLPLHYKLCDTCTSDFAGATESKLNKRALMAWRKKVDGLLSGAEITALRQQYDLTQAAASKLFGGGPVAFSKYENDDVMQSEAMDTLLRLVRRSKETFWALVEEKGLQTEFQRQKVSVTIPPNIIHVNFSRSDGGEQANPYYNDPREFRRYGERKKEVSCH
jgi:HTH-type transcriptional regulator/antitoxin MqsA